MNDALIPYICFVYNTILSIYIMIMCGMCELSLSAQAMLLHSKNMSVFFTDMPFINNYLVCTVHQFSSDIFQDTNMWVTLYCMNTHESHRHCTAMDEQHFNIDFLMQGKLAFDKSLQVYGGINIERHGATESLLSSATLWRSLTEMAAWPQVGNRDASLLQHFTGLTPKPMSLYAIGFSSHVIYHALRGCFRTMALSLSLPLAHRTSMSHHNGAI